MESTFLPEWDVLCSFAVVVEQNEKSFSLECCCVSVFSSVKQIKSKHWFIHTRERACAVSAHSTWTVCWSACRCLQRGPRRPSWTLMGLGGWRFSRHTYHRYGYLVGMPTDCLPMEVFQACPTGRRPRGRPRSRWRDYISALAWEHLGFPQSELADVTREREVWDPLLKLLPQQPQTSSWWWMDRWTFNFRPFTNFYTIC